MGKQGLTIRGVLLLLRGIAAKTHVTITTANLRTKGFFLLSHKERSTSR
jgi:hypothetical protein